MSSVREAAEAARVEAQAKTVMVLGQFYRESVALQTADAFAALGWNVVRSEAGIGIGATTSVLKRRIDQLRFRLHDLASNIRSYRDRFTRRLLGDAERTPIDLVVVCYDYLQPHELRLLKEATGAKIVFWFPDAISNFSKAMFLNADYDALFFKDPYIVHMLRRCLTKPVYYLPEFCIPSSLEPAGHEDSEPDEYWRCDIATAGNLYTYRAEFFSRLTDYDVKIWGNPPPLWLDDSAISGMVQSRYVVGREKIRAFQGAKIVLNSLNPAEIWGLNARTFETAGIGAFQLLDWRPGLAQLFEDGAELVSFRTMEDLREKIDHYLAHPEEREAIAKRGHERALRDHTLERRVECVLQTLRGEAEGFPMPEIEAGTAPAAR
jgi:spore maturation protein CgeB